MISALRAIRRRDSEGTATLVADETPFSQRPLLPLPVEARKTLNDLDVRERADVLDTVSFVGGRALTLDPNRRKLHVSDGARISFDRLLGATGSRDRRPVVSVGRVAAEFIGRIDRAGLYAALIRRGEPVTRWKDRRIAGRLGPADLLAGAMPRPPS